MLQFWFEGRDILLLKYIQNRPQPSMDIAMKNCRGSYKGYHVQTLRKTEERCHVSSVQYSSTQVIFGLDSCYAWPWHLNRYQPSLSSWFVVIWLPPVSEPENKQHLWKHFLKMGSKPCNTGQSIVWSTKGVTLKNKIL